MSKADILIVEDDIITATVIKKYLEKNNYNVLEIISNGEIAIEKALALNPDLILLDIFLKNSIDGIEVARKINEEKEIPVLFLTADSSDDTIQRAKITHPYGYLVKPIESSVLITNIELTLDKQLSYNKKILEALKKANDELEMRVKERTEELVRVNKDLKIEMDYRLRIEEELRITNTLATIGKMSAILAHEIRNPLNSIRINADILIENPIINDNQKKRIKIIQKEVDRLNNLVKDVLMFTRQGNLLESEFNLLTFMKGFQVQLHDILQEKNIELEINIPDIKLRGDIEKLKQVFLNLLNNSIDAIYQIGKIEITALINGDNKIIIDIKDNGSGVPNPDKLFDPFFTTKNLGTGLGLSISQNILRQHKGDLYLLRSKPTETIFRIEFPLSK